MLLIRIINGLVLSYLGSMGICILAGGMFAAAPKRLKLIRRTLVFVVVGVLAARSWQRNTDWHSDYSLHRAGFQDNPNNVKIVSNMGLIVHERSKETGRSLDERQALARQAQQIYEKAIQRRLLSAALFFQHGNLLHEQGRHNEAIESYLAGLRLQDAGRVTIRILVNLASVYVTVQRFKEAERYFLAALELDEANLSALNGLGVLHGTLGEYDKAEKYFSATVKTDPHYVEGLFNYGTLLAKQNKAAAAKLHFQRALTLAPGHVGARNNLEVVELQLKGSGIE